MNRQHPTSRLQIAFRNAVYELEYRRCTPTGLQRGEAEFVIGVHETYAEARRHFDVRKGSRVVGTWSDGVVDRIRNLDKALARLDCK